MDSNNIETDLQANISSKQQEMHQNDSIISSMGPQIVPDISHFNNTNSVLQCAKVLTVVCLTFGIIALIGTLYIIIGPATYPRDYPRQKLALIFSLSFTLSDFLKAFGTASCVAALIAIIITKSRHKIRVKKLLVTVICSIVMIYLLSIMNGITLYTHFPEYGEYPFLGNQSYQSCHGTYSCW